MKKRLQLPKLPTRRIATKRNVFRRLHANLFTKRASTTADPAAIEGDVPNMGVGRALMVILLLHVVAVIGYYIHKTHFESSGSETISSINGSNNKDKKSNDTRYSIPSLDNLPNLNEGDKRHMVVAGDNYASISASVNVSEQDLRDYNHNVPLTTGLILRIPPKTIKAQESAELTALRGGKAPVADARITPPASRAIQVKPNINRESTPKAIIVEEEGLQETTASHELRNPALLSTQDKNQSSYTTKRGDTFYSIARKFGISPATLMKHNGIRSANTLRTGQTLKIPK